MADNGAHAAAAENHNWICSLQCPSCSSVFEVRVSQTDLLLVRQSTCPMCTHRPFLTRPDEIWSAIMVHRLVRMRASTTAKTNRKVIRSRRPRVGPRARQ
jgi:hypothetical protein